MLRRNKRNRPGYYQKFIACRTTACRIKVNREEALAEKAAKRISTQRLLDKECFTRGDGTKFCKDPKTGEFINIDGGKPTFSLDIFKKNIVKQVNIAKEGTIITLKIVAKTGTKKGREEIYQFIIDNENKIRAAIVIADAIALGLIVVGSVIAATGAGAPLGGAVAGIGLTLGIASSKVEKILDKGILTVQKLQQLEDAVEVAKQVATVKKSREQLIEDNKEKINERIEILLDISTTQLRKMAKKLNIENISITGKASLSRKIAIAEIIKENEDREPKIGKSKLQKEREIEIKKGLTKRRELERQLAELDRQEELQDEDRRLAQLIEEAEDEEKEDIEFDAEPLDIGRGPGGGGPGGGGGGPGRGGGPGGVAPKVQTRAEADAIALAQKDINVPRQLAERAAADKALADKAAADREAAEQVALINQQQFKAQEKAKDKLNIDMAQKLKEARERTAVREAAERAAADKEAEERAAERVEAITEEAIQSRAESRAQIRAEEIRKLEEIAALGLENTSQREEERPSSKSPVIESTITDTAGLDIGERGDDFIFSKISNKVVINKTSRRKLEKAFKTDILNKPKNFNNPKKLTEEQLLNAKGNRPVQRQKAATFNNNQDINIYNKIIRDITNAPDCRIWLANNVDKINILPKKLKEELRDYCEVIMNDDDDEEIEEILED